MAKLDRTFDEINNALAKTYIDGYNYFQGRPDAPLDGDQRQVAGTNQSLQVYDASTETWVADGLDLGATGITVDEQVVVGGTGNVLTYRLKKNAGEWRVNPFSTFGPSGLVEELKSALFFDEGDASLITNTGTTNHEAVLDGDLYVLGINVAARGTNYEIKTRTFMLGDTSATETVQYSAYEATDSADDDKLIISRPLPASLFSGVAGTESTYALQDIAGEPTYIAELGDKAYYVELVSTAPFSLYGDATQPQNSATGLRFIYEYLKTDCNCHFGDNFEKFESESETTATSTFADKVSGTTATLPAGTYRVGFTCEITETSSSCEVRFMIDGSAVHNHTTGNDEIEPNLEDYNWQTVGSFYYITIATEATKTLAIQYKDNGTAKMSNATIEIWRVS